MYRLFVIDWLDYSVVSLAQGFGVKRIISLVFLLLCFSSFSFMNSNSPSPSETCIISNSKEVAQDLGLRLVGQVGGATQAVALKGNYAYTGIGMRVVVLNVSKPKKPRQVGSSEALPSSVTGIFITGKKAYVTAGGSGLYIMDLKNSRSPRLLASHDTQGYSENVVVEGKFAYVADGGAGLAIIDIADPSKPHEVGSIGSLGYTFDIAVANNLAYIAAGGSGLKIIDVKDPQYLVEIGHCNTPGYAYALVLSEDKKKVYLADEWEGITLIDISDPYQPRSVSSYNTPGWAFGATIKGGTLYVADAFKGLRVLDVSNPLKLAWISSYETDGHAEGVAFSGNNVFIADRINGLRIINVSDNSHPKEIGLYSPLSYANAVDASGNYAYVAAGSQGLRIFDIANPAHPKEIGKYETSDFVYGVSVSGKYAYFITMPGNCFYVLDISNKKNPKKTGQYLLQEPGAFMNLTISGKMAYIPDETGLLLINISNPKKPSRAGFISLWEPHNNAVGVEICGKLAYVATQSAGINIVDVSHPKNLQLIGNFRCESSFSWNVAVENNRAYIADYHGLRILDVSDPSSPIQLGFYNTQGGARDVTAEGNRVFIANGNSGVSLVDASNPTNPSLLAEYNTPGFAYTVKMKGSKILVTDGRTGLLILEASPLSYAKVTQSRPAQKTKVNHRESLRKRVFKRIPHKPMFIKSKITPSREVKSEKRAGWPSTLTHVVTSRNDSGPGTLRYFIDTIQKGDTITFDTSVFPPNNPQKIMVRSQLRWITQSNITIDASNAGVILDGRDSEATGIMLHSDGNILRGLQVCNFPYGGISIEGDGNIIGGDRKKGKAPVGQGNLISGNSYDGISVRGNENIISGNLIGTDASGKKAWENDTGISLSSAHNNRIGGNKPGERNIISGNNWWGIIPAGSSGNSIIGNYIGTDISGKHDLGNGLEGIYLVAGSYNNLVKSNLVSGNDHVGVNISDWGSSYNTVVGNIIGLDIHGKKVLINDGAGISLGYDGASFNRIGGPSPRERNIISGHGETSGTGVEIDSRGSDNFVMGNYIGTDSTGKGAFFNHTGISIWSDHNFIGGFTQEERNVVSGNLYGIGLSYCSYNAIMGNYIGMDSHGTSTIHNQYTGISIDIKTSQNGIYGNLISGTLPFGLYGDRNSIINNVIIKSVRGLEVMGSSNLIFQNRFLLNQIQALDQGHNQWSHNGRGNYWDDYTGKDNDANGIGDTPYYIPETGVDHFPLMSESSRLNLNVLPQGSGKITKKPSKYNYDFGENVRLTAAAKSGYEFSTWSGDVPQAVIMKNPVTITLNTTKRITAHFIPSAVSPSFSLVTVSKKYLNFAAVLGGTRTPDQLFQVVSSCEKPVFWRITANARWLTCTPASGRGNAVVAVSVDPSGLAAGAYAALICIQSPESNSLRYLSVALQVISPSEESLPWGEWDSPGDLSYPVTGIIPFSGWALDRIGVENVMIYRLKGPGETPSDPQEIYIGGAFFVGGARPDIEEALSHYPLCDRAGWGYNFPSQLLPKSGIHTFIVRARSLSGKEVELGRRQVIVNNNFHSDLSGSLDYPRPAEILTGQHYPVIGWVLGWGRTSASTVDLYIDSRYVQTLSGGFPHPVSISLWNMVYRSLPGFLATLKLADLSPDFHTVFLSASDETGRASVMGSRWFLNSDSIYLTDMEPGKIQLLERMGANHKEHYGRVILEKRRIEPKLVTGKEIRIKVNQLRHVGIKGFSTKEKNIIYQAIYRDQTLLPLGMTLDKTAGILSWLPIPGFKGRFEVKMLKYGDGVLSEEKTIIFIVE